MEKIVRYLRNAVACSLFCTCWINGAYAYDAVQGIDYLLPYQQLPPYFVDSFNDLVDSQWNENGDWDNDVQNDATAFAPELLYQVDRAIGEGPGEYYQRAYQTSRWESKLIGTAIIRFFKGELTERDAFDIAVGSNSFAACARYALPVDAGFCKSHMKTILNLANFAFLSPIFRWLGLFEGQEAMLYARLAFINLEYFKATGLVAYKTAAEKLTVRMEQVADPDQDGIFSGWAVGWNQASPLVTYASLYEITGNAVYLEKANRMIAVLDHRFLFGTPGETEAYWEVEHTGYVSTETQWILASSTHVQYFEAYVILAAATGDTYFVERANRFLNFAIQHFYIPNHGGYHPHFAHDISWPAHETAPTTREIEYNDNYCTGESFNFLRNAWSLMSVQRSFDFTPQ